MEIEQVLQGLDSLLERVAEVIELFVHHIATVGADEELELLLFLCHTREFFLQNWSICGTGNLEGRVGNLRA